jgi:hypothetical protein
MIERGRMKLRLNLLLILVFACRVFAVDDELA